MYALRIFVVFMIFPLSTQTRADDADSHNVIRDALSDGKTLTNLGAFGNTTYDFSQQYRPSTPLSNLTVSASLVSTTTSYTSQCKYAHSGTADVGENLFAGTGTSWTVVDAVNAFAVEALGYTYGTVSGSEICNLSPPEIPSCGHYTQLCGRTQHK